MRYRSIFPALVMAALLLNAGWSRAADNKPVGPQQAASKASASQKGAAIGKSEMDTQRKAAVPIQLVDINRATRQELKSLPGIRDTEAARIIAGRPYLSKAQLVTRNVLKRDVYENLKRLIIAKQL